MLVGDLRDCYGALGVIHSIWKPIPGRFKDYIAMPKFNMYQSLHTTVMSHEGKLLEIQIRTEEMDRTAEYGIAAHWMYKEGRKDSEVDRLSWLTSMMEWQKETPDAAEFMESLKGELGADEVYVFTPKGDVISLPSGATPIDFSYHVHTEVGHRTIGAKVNGRIVPLDSELVSGDRVEVVTGKSSGPSRDWLEVVQSGRARNKIRQFFNKEDREDNLASGREKVVSLLKKRHIGKVPSGILQGGRPGHKPRHAGRYARFRGRGQPFSRERGEPHRRASATPQRRTGNPKRQSRASPASAAGHGRWRRTRNWSPGGGIQRGSYPVGPLLHPDAGR